MFTVCCPGCGLVREVQDQYPEMSVTGMTVQCHKCGMTSTVYPPIPSNTVVANLRGTTVPFRPMPSTATSKKNQSIWVIMFAVIMVVVFFMIIIMGIISAIAIPNLLRARVDSNESAAIRNLRAINIAEVTYNAAKGTYGSLADLTAYQANGPKFLDGDWIGTKQGYDFTISTKSTTKYEATAVPSDQGKSGIRGFFTDESGVIRGDEFGIATVHSKPIGGE